MHKYILTALFFLLLSLPALANDLQTSAKQAYIMDYETGTALLSKNAQERMPTSSMSKVMSMALVYDALQKGKISLSDAFIVSEKAWQKQGSKMFVELGNKIKVEDLIRGVVIQSGNDATIVLAEGLSGSEDNFAAELNKKAAEIGMKNSHFMNASGWPDPEHYSTAEDLAKLGVYMIKTYPEDYKYYSEKEFTYHGITQPNRNPLLYRDIGADGIKTGHTEAGGYGLMGSGMRDGRRVVLVLNGMASEKERAEESARLLDWALGRFENKTLLMPGEIIANAAVIMGKANTVGLTVKTPLRLTIPKGSNKDIKATIEYEAPLVAPINTDQPVAQLIITMPGLNPIKTPLFAAENISEKGFFALSLERIKILILGIEGD